MSCGHSKAEPLPAPCPCFCPCGSVSAWPSITHHPSSPVTHHPLPPVTHRHPSQLSHAGTCHLGKGVTVFRQLPKSPRVLGTWSGHGGWCSLPVGWRQPVPGLQQHAEPRPREGNLARMPKFGCIGCAAVKDTHGPAPRRDPGPTLPPPRGTCGGGTRRWAGRRGGGGVSGRSDAPAWEEMGVA